MSNSAINPVIENYSQPQEHVPDLLYGASARVIEILKRDLKECGLSREEVVIRLTAKWRWITVAMLDAFIARSKPHRFPAELIPAWVEVTGSRRLLEMLCGEAGLSVATSDDLDFADLGRTHLHITRLMTRLRERHER